MLGVKVVPVPVHDPPTDKVDAEVLLLIIPAVKDTLPATTRFPPVKFNLLAAPLNVRLLQLPVWPVDKVGQLVPEAGITTAVEAVGTVPLHQLVVTFQSALVVPSQVPAVHAETTSKVAAPVLVDPVTIRVLPVPTLVGVTLTPFNCPAVNAGEVPVIPAVPV